jgi:hypothetical protein
MEGLPVKIMAKDGNCQILPLKLQRGLSVYTDTHTHGKVLWFQLLGTIVKGMPTQDRIELNFIWNLFVQCPPLM